MKLLLILAFIGYVNCATLSEMVNHQRIHERPKPQVQTQTKPHTQKNSTADYWFHVAQEILCEKLSTKLIKRKAKNIILFLGDGMSIPTLAATRMYMGGEHKQLSFEKFPFTGLSKTYCEDYEVPDSACTSTAYLCGIKANLGTIGVSSSVNLSDCFSSINPKNHVYSIAKWAQDSGKATGLVTTTTVTHASPAGVYAHTSDRFWESNQNVKDSGCDDKTNYDIAEQLIQGEVGSKLNVIMGGGRKNFLPTTVKDNEGIAGVRTDGKNLIDEWKKYHQHKAQYVYDKAGLNKIKKKTTTVLGLFANSHMPYNIDITPDKPRLHEMVQKAIEVLSRNKNGFFLFVEGGEIDFGHHFNLPHVALDETFQFSLAVDVAKSLTKEKNTLIVVTSDHSHTMSISGYPVRGADIFGPAGNLAKDNLPISTLSYANGPGYYAHTKSNGERNDIRTMNYTSNKYLAPALAPLDVETHGGDDVAIFACGPFAHLFSGVVEENYIPHGMAYAACIGPGKTFCDEQISYE